MRKKRRDANRIVIQKMLGYCVEIESLKNRFNATLETYVTDSAFRLACDMCILQIGELTTRLADEFKARCAEIPWHKIKGLRNIHVHDYESIKYETMWGTLTEDIPELKAQLEKILAEEESNDTQI